MQDDTIDLLKIKIETAKRQLPLETVNAIDAVDWQAAILSLRGKSGYTFEQLGDLETETELVLCGLLNPASYPKELENRMNISRAAANELVNEMNDLVFKKIREELIKNTERKNIFAKKNSPLEEYSDLGRREVDVPPRPLSTKSTPQEGNEKMQHETSILNSAGIKIIPDLPTIPRVQVIQPEKLELTGEVHPILAQKFSGPVQTKIVETNHTLENITKTLPASPINIPTKPKIDPYREIPE
jgi:hypothetical protein